MASDHRGRELHAGKRTAQEMGWKARDYEGDDGTTSETVFTKGTFGQHLVVSQSPISESYTWRTTTPMSEDEVAGVSQYIGRGKTNTVFRKLDSNTPDDAYTVVTSGSTRTPARAMIAAEAMKSRIKEGRDLKTGRPKK